MSERHARPSTRGNSSRSGSKGGSAFIRGEAGMRRTDEEIERQKQRSEERRNASNKPFRFFVPVGETRQIIVCDDKPDFFLYEHALKDSEGRWGRLFTGCIKEHDNCPVCTATGKESYYAMVLTVVDLTPFDTRDGNTVEFSRKLLIVKPAQQKKFLRFYNKEGTLRGAMFDMTRDGDKDSSIGNDIEFVEFVDEKELATYARSWKDREGKKHNELCSEPYVYEDIFEEPTMENLSAIVGADPVPGSRAANSRELGGRGSSSRGRSGSSDGWEDDKEERKFGKSYSRKGKEDDDEDEEEDEAPRRPARREHTASTSRGKVATRRSSRDDDEEEEEDEAPKRQSRTTRGAASTATPRGRGRAKDEDEEEQDDEDEAPPRRSTRAAASRTTAKGKATTRGRKSDDDDEDIEEDDIPF